VPPWQNGSEQSHCVIPSLVSIGIPVFNGERYLEQALRANLNQTATDFELIISDNASTDRTEMICRDYAASDSRVRFYRNERNVGAAANYNRLFHLAKGEFFRWSNADDLIAPNLVATLLPVLHSRPDVAIVYARTRLIDAEGNTIEDFNDNLDLQSDDASERYIELVNRLRLTNIIYGLMRASAMRRTELMGNGKLPAGDVSFLAAMVLLGKFVSADGTFFYRRMHDGAFSANRDPVKQQLFWRGSAKATTFASWRARLAEHRAILRSPIPARQKARLLGYSAKRLYWHRRQLASEVLGLFARARPTSGCSQ
jgi:glycosyltransferase involved in cell wall biosynthesis